MSALIHIGYCFVIATAAHAQFTIVIIKLMNFIIGLDIFTNRRYLF